jgi:hypothetical protein
MELELKIRNRRTILGRCRAGATFCSRARAAHDIGLRDSTYDAPPNCRAGFIFLTALPSIARRE